jgi:adenylate cyclase
MAENADRRLAAIVIADVVGYSRLIQQDEEGTRALFRRLQSEVFQPKIDAEGGRLVKSMGDAFLLEFPSAVAAVRCIIDIQKALPDAQAEISEEKRIQFRVGINVGDVVVEDDDLHGDGVNIAARLEALSEPSEIVISRTARDQVRDRMDIGFEDLGEIEVKNIARPVRAFRVMAERDESTDPISKPWWRYSVAVIVALSVLVGGAALWWRFQPGVLWVDLTKTIGGLPDKPSLAILPFKSLGSEKDAKLISDGLALDISQQLTRDENFKVIGRSATGRYRKDDADPLTAARELNVRYLLTGAVRVFETRLRVNTELLDTNDGRQIWAERYEGDLTVNDIFRFQDQITRKVIAVIGGGLGIIAKETQSQMVGRSTINLSSYECIVSVFTYWETVTPQTHRYSRDCLEATVKREPKNAEAWGHLSFIYVQEYSIGFNPKPNSIGRALVAAESALRADANDPMAWLSLAYVRFFRKEIDAFQNAASRTLKIRPNDPIFTGIISFLYSNLGEHEKALAMMEKTMEVMPFPPFWYHSVANLAAQDRRNWKEVLENSNLHDPPYFWWGTARKVIANAYLGKHNDARMAVENLAKVKPDYQATIVAELERWNAPVNRIEAWIGGFKKIGIEIDAGK